MGFFKNIGSKLKRVISIKNLTNVATGQFGAVAKDALRVATTNAPVKKGAGTTVDTTFLNPNTQIPPQAMSVIEGQGKVFGAKVSQAISGEPAVQNVADFFTKTYLQSMYEKYKTWVILIFVSVVSLILYKVLGKKKSTRARVRR
jgi:hypothetical protein